ncbi:NUDIX hydrolase [Rhodococcus sp. NPDC058505]|uniref:NUDIX hydrolase n=1 Tax=unclassified Rhodococcus (in: high G+C Gram-positive bacteria) TaxID=192944 RepID=UPI0036661F55
MAADTARPTTGQASPELTRQRCAAALTGFAVEAAPEAGGRRAAVALALVERDDGPVLLLTLRPGRMRAHPGQFALPGGGIDPGETPAQAALRELDEEVGVTAPDDAVLGVLDDFVTRSGYVITPVVVWVGSLAAPLRPNPGEVAMIFEVTVPELDVDPVLRPLPGGTEPLLRWPFRGEHLFAPTAAIIHQFREVVLHGRATRVADCPQPDFAAR